MQRPGQLQARALDVLIPVKDAHEVRAGPVGGVGDRPGQVGVLDVVGQDDHVLSGCDVCPEVDREPGEVAVRSAAIEDSRATGRP